MLGTPLVRTLLTASAALCLAAGLARADVVIFGGLGNFDVPNREGDDCNEFEIELDLATSDAVTLTVNNCQTFCDLDFTKDGNVDQDDVASLVNVVAGGHCP